MKKLSIITLLYSDSVNFLRKHFAWENVLSALVWRPFGLIRQLMIRKCSAGPDFTASKHTEKYFPPNLTCNKE